ncbi:hypothetical protein BC937DRAFT_92843 [Endogone sp. FLAS-F59071]|nr:hypothetical protein BC937DRAFT_92843 [Endogone sp. FLAS-F59071]|eukprot:RUS21390.1 hypothetical protein BC937DRAFT_92843 [Endogone sp. FLAS-F59071]
MGKLCMYPGANFSHYAFQLGPPRFMFLAFSPADWAIAVKELIRVTKPGGWIELFEYDMQLQRAGPSFDKLHAALTKVAATRGIDLGSVHHLPDLTKSLEAVESDHVSAPLGWDGRASAATAWALRAEFCALRERLGSVLGLSEDEYEELVEKMAGEMAQRRAWVTMPYLYGRKPDGRS